jgi:hypothetical protein
MEKWLCATSPGWESLAHAISTPGNLVEPGWMSNSPMRPAGAGQVHDYSRGSEQQRKPT